MTWRIASCKGCGGSAVERNCKLIHYKFIITIALEFNEIKFILRMI